MLPAATVAPVVRNIVHRRLLAIFCSTFKFCWVLATFSHGLSRYTCRALRGRVLLRPGGSKAHCGLAQRCVQ